jgi:hypothetical protein
MNRQPYSRFIKNRYILFLLVAFIPCAVLIASLSHPYALAIYPECKICKFVAQIFLSGTVVSQAVILPYFAGVIHTIESSPCAVITQVITHHSFAYTYIVSEKHKTVASIAAVVEGSRAPPFTSIL